jgi:hypothetical protein
MQTYKTLHKKHLVNKWYWFKIRNLQKQCYIIGSFALVVLQQTNRNKASRNLQRIRCKIVGLKAEYFYKILVCYSRKELAGVLLRRWKSGNMCADI